MAMNSGFLKVDDEFLLDERRRRLSCIEREVHLAMSFRSWRGGDANGVHLDGEVLVTPRQLVEMTGYSRSAVYDAIRGIVAVGLAERRGGRTMLIRGGEHARTVAPGSATADSSSATADTSSATAEKGKGEFAAEGLAGPPEGRFGAASESFRVQANGTESVSDHPFSDEPLFGEAVEKRDEREWIPVTHTRSGQPVYVRA